MRIFSVLSIALLFSFPAAAQVTPAGLEKILSEGLPASVSADNTVTVTEKGSDWVISYPAFRVPQSDGSSWQVGTATVILIKPTGTGVADATVVMPVKSTRVDATGKALNVVTLTGQDLKGKWSFDRNMLTEMNGTVKTAQWRDDIQGALNEINNLRLNAKANFKSATMADLDFDVQSSDARAVPMTVVSGFLPKKLLIKGRAMDVPVETLRLGMGMMPVGSPQQIFTQAGTGVGIQTLALSALNGVNVTGEGAMKAQTGSTRGMVGRFQTVWHGLDALYRDTQAKMISANATPEERSAATQTLLGLMILQGVGVRQPDDTHILVADLLPDGRTLLNGKDLPAAPMGGVGGNGALPGLPAMLNPVQNANPGKNLVDSDR